MKEIITLGIGNYGSLVGAHFTNSLTNFDQENNVHFFETNTTINNNMSNRAPRLLLLDGPQVHHISNERQLNTINESLNLIATDEEEIEDNEEEEIEDNEEEEIEDNEEEEIEDNEEVKIFSDHSYNEEWWKYIQSSLHSKSITVINSSQYHSLLPDNNTAMIDEYSSIEHCYGYGVHHYNPSSIYALETYTDHIRWHLECSDYCQGIQLYNNANSVWGGITENILTYSRDDIIGTYTSGSPTIPLITFSSNMDPLNLSNSINSKIEARTILNLLLSTVNHSNLSSLFSPIAQHSFTSDYTTLDSYRNQLLDNAALTAMAGDSCLHSYKEQSSLSHACSLLRSNNSNRITGISLYPEVSIPTPEISLSEMVYSAFNSFPNDNNTMNYNIPSLTSYSYLPCNFPSFSTPKIRMNKHEMNVYLKQQMLSQLVNIRGFNKNYNISDSQIQSLISDYQTPNSSINYYNEPYPISSSFPDTLFNYLWKRNSNTKKLPIENMSDISQISLSSHWFNSTSCHSYLQKLLTNALYLIKRRAPPQSLLSQIHNIKDLTLSHIGHQYEYELDEWLDIIEAMESLTDNYSCDILPDSDDSDIE